VLNNQAFDSSQPFPLNLQPWPNEVSNIPDVNAFIRQLLAQTRSDQPEAQPVSPKADGLTDIGFYRVAVYGGAVGMHLTPLAQSLSTGPRHPRLPGPSPMAFAVGLAERSSIPFLALLPGPGAGFAIATQNWLIPLAEDCPVYHTTATLKAFHRSSGPEGSLREDALAVIDTMFQQCILRGLAG
jgi:hypothetical protein